jgi:hypothetical protein
LEVIPEMVSSLLPGGPPPRGLTRKLEPLTTLRHTKEEIRLLEAAYPPDVKELVEGLLQLNGSKVTLYVSERDR